MVLVDIRCGSEKKHFQSTSQAHFRSVSVHFVHFGPICVTKFAHFHTRRMEIF